MATDALGILPVPKETLKREGTFFLTPETLIALLPEAGDSEWFAAQSLQQEIEKATGLKPAIIKTTRPPRTENLILLSANSQKAAHYLGLPIPDETIKGRGEQAYFVAISPQRVIAGGMGYLAVHYAVQTLRQIACLAGTRWPACQINDWPVFPYRGIMLDISRGKVPTLETLKEIVARMSLYKINVFQLYTEHTFAFPSHPRIGWGTDPLTTEDILALDAFARQHHVMLMPNLNSFGHCGHLLSLPEYAHLAESAVPWTLSPVEEGTYKLLGELYDDMLPAFSVPILNAGCDETWDLGKGRSATIAAQIGIGRLYLQHLLRLYEMAKARGFRIQFWGDILLHYPELVSELPEDVILLDWHYETEEHYPSVEIFAQSGRPFWVCPGTSSWNTIFPRIENANANIRNLARAGAEKGAEGLLNTDWGDHGHYQPLGQSWYGYVFGAAQAWSGGQTSDDVFDARFGPLWFGTPGPEITAAIRALGRLNTLPGMPRPNASNSIYLLLDEPLVGETALQTPKETLSTIIQVCHEAEHTFRQALPFSRDPLSLEEMIYSARLFAYAARKAQATQEINQALTQNVEPRTVEHCRATLRALELELVALQGEFVRLWRARARDSEIHIALGHLENLRRRFILAQQWLFDHREAPERARDRESYSAWAGPYEILGQRFWRLMQQVVGQG